jgi:glycosyltransferase involved in cell wall biosynthesis
MLMRRPYDVIHSHEEASILAMLLAGVFRINHLYDMHSSLPRQLHNYRYGRAGWLVHLFGWLERRVIRSATAIITIDPELDSHVRQLNPAANTATIHNLPIQATASLLPDKARQLRERLRLAGRPVLLYTGNFEPYQGLALLMDSAERLIPQHPELAIVLVGGDDDQVARWRQAAADRGLDDHFHFTGIVPIGEIPAYLEMAAILVSPRLDGTSVPLKLYTYLLSGKPLVATLTDGHTQVLTDEVAVLVEPEADALAAGIARLLSDPELADRIGGQARHLAQEKYGFALYLESLDRIYRTLAPRQAMSAAPAAALEK